MRFGDLEEAHVAIERDRRLKLGHGVQPHGSVADLLRRHDAQFGEATAETEAPCARAQIQALHFAPVAVIRPEPDAADDRPIGPRQPQPAGRRRITARQVRKFPIETLEA